MFANLSVERQPPHHLWTTKGEPHSKYIHTSWSDTRVLERERNHLLDNIRAADSPCRIMHGQKSYSGGLLLTQPLLPVRPVQFWHSTHLVQSLQLAHSVQSLQSTQSLQKPQSVHLTQSMQSLHFLQSTQLVQSMHPVQSLHSVQSLQSVHSTSTMVDICWLGQFKHCMVVGDPPHTHTPHASKKNGGYSGGLLFLQPFLPVRSVQFVHSSQSVQFLQL